MGCPWVALAILTTGGRQLTMILVIKSREYWKNSQKCGKSVVEMDAAV